MSYQTSKRNYFQHLTWNISLEIKILSNKILAFNLRDFSLYRNDILYDIKCQFTTTHWRHNSLISWVAFSDNISIVAAQTLTFELRSLCLVVFFSKLFQPWKFSTWSSFRRFLNGHFTSFCNFYSLWLFWKSLALYLSVHHGRLRNLTLLRSQIRWIPLPRFWFGVEFSISLFLGTYMNTFVKNLIIFKKLAD